MGDIKVLEYSVGKGRGRGWSVTFTSSVNKDVGYNGPYIGFKQIQSENSQTSTFMKQIFSDIILIRQLNLKKLSLNGLMMKKP